METLLQGIPGVFIYINDILITGRTNEEHLKHLAEVLLRLKEAGMRLKREKFAYNLLPSVDYLGHTISAEGSEGQTPRQKQLTKPQHPRTLLNCAHFWT